MRGQRSGHTRSTSPPRTSPSTFPSLAPSRRVPIPLSACCVWQHSLASCRAARIPNVSGYGARRISLSGSSPLNRGTPGRMCRASSAVFREFLLKNFDVSAVNTLASGVGYLITSRLPGIFGAGGDEPVARTDRFLLDLETARAADACKARSRAAAGGARGHRGRPAHGTRSACFACRRAIRVQRFRGKGREGIWTA